MSWEPCYEHKERSCTRHMAKSYPKTAFGFHSMRFGLGFLVTALIGAVGALLWSAIAAHGMLTLYVPLGAFFVVMAIYGVGWGVMACFRLGKKSSGT